MNAPVSNDTVRMRKAESRLKLDLFTDIVPGVEDSEPHSLAKWDGLSIVLHVLLDFSNPAAPIFSRTIFD